MSLLSSFVTVLPARLGRAWRSILAVLAVLAAWAPRPVPVLVPIPVRARRRAQDAVERRRRHGV